MDRPFVYLFVGLFTGIAACTLFVYTNIIVALILAIVLFSIIFKTLPIKIAIFIMSYFILGIISFNMYFRFNMPREFAEARIIEDKGYYYIAEYEGRKLKVTNAKDSLELGRSYLLQGEFQGEPNYSRGIIGTFIIENLDKGKVDFTCKIYSLKRDLFNKFSKELGKDNAAILMGVCYGDSSYLSYDYMEAFNELGISHVISVSGLHTSLIYGVLSVIIGYRLSIIVLFIYVIFTGAKSATMRAFIMIVVLVLSKKLKKNYDPISALSFAAFVLILFKPYYILDAGYCLSFLGMLGIYLFYNTINRKLYKLPKALNQSISMTLAASFFTVPYIMFIFKTFTLGGFISNLIVIPFYTFVVVVGNFCLIVYKMETIFNIFLHMLISIFSIINTSQEFLLTIIPAPLNVSYMEGLALLMLYPTYMLIKRGYRSLIYMPIVLCFLVLLDGYKFTPEIRYINGGSFNVVCIDYKYKTLLISPQKVKLSKIYENIFVDEIYDEFEEPVEIKLSDKYKIKGTLEHRDLTLGLFYENKCTIFLNEDVNIKPDEELVRVNHLIGEESSEKKLEVGNEDISVNNNLVYSEQDISYDIIRIAKDKNTVLKGRFFKWFKVVKGKVFETYIP